MGGAGANERGERFQSLYQTHFQAMYAYVARRVPPPEVTDVLQEVFSVAWRARRVPEPPEDRLWLYGIARRVVSRSHWKLARRMRLTERLAASPSVVASPAGLSDPVQVRLEEALAALRPRDLELVRLLIWDDLPRADVARLLGCSVNVVDIRFHRAMKRLRQGLLPTRAPDPLEGRPLPAHGSTGGPCA